MSDEQAPNEQGGSVGAEPAETFEEAAQADRDAREWGEVANALDELGQAVTAWARALKDDPDTRRHARDLKEGFERLGGQMGDTLDSATDTEFGKSVAEAAGRAGAAMTDAARKAGDQVAPFVVNALRGAADGIRRAADGLERRAGSGSDESAEAAGGSPEPPAPPVPEPPAAPEPPPAAEPSEADPADE